MLAHYFHFGCQLQVYVVTSPRMLNTTCFTARSRYDVEGRPKFMGTGQLIASVECNVTCGQLRKHTVCVEHTSVLLPSSVLNALEIATNVSAAPFTTAPGTLLWRQIHLLKTTGLSVLTVKKLMLSVWRSHLLTRSPLFHQTYRNFSFFFSRQAELSTIAHDLLEALQACSYAACAVHILSMTSTSAMEYFQATQLTCFC